MITVTPPTSLVPNDQMDFDLFDDPLESDTNTNLDQLKPKAYIFPILNHSDQSTPSDSRSICDTPDSDPWTIPEMRTVGPQWNGKCRIFFPIELGGKDGRR